MSLMPHFVAALLALFVVSTIVCTIHTAHTTFSTVSSQPHSEMSAVVPTSNTVTEQFVQTALAQAPQPIPPLPQGSAERPPACSDDDRETALWQLPPDDCDDSCPSVENETACPVEGWMHAYLQTFDSMHDFLGLTVGCDTVSNVMTAVDVLRRASKQGVMDAGMSEFQTIVEDRLFPNQPRESTCAPPLEVTTPMTNADPSKYRVAEMHCIEPMPYVVDPLHAVVTSLGWNDPSSEKAPKMVVSPVAIAKDHGGRLFLPLEPMDDHVHHRHESVVDECAQDASQGLVNANLRTQPKCRAVPTYSLNSYLKSFAPQQRRIIHYLKLDGEGYDYDMLLGSGQGADDVLRRTLYLQFERHSKGSWADQSLRELVSKLDQSLGFTCYLAGRHKLWRISSERCFLDHYDVPSWSNVACVNRVLPGAKALLEIMEQTYHQTLARKHTFVSAKVLQTGRRPHPEGMTSAETNLDSTRHLS